MTDPSRILNPTWLSCWRTLGDPRPIFLINRDTQPPLKSACNCAYLAIINFRREPQSRPIEVKCSLRVNLRYGEGDWGPTLG
jgi:hypothetical protein